MENETKALLINGVFLALFIYSIYSVGRFVKQNPDTIKKKGYWKAIMDASVALRIGFVYSLFVILMGLVIGFAELTDDGGSSSQNQNVEMLDSEEACMNFLQGKWMYTHHMGRTRDNIHFRLEIKGNQVKIWSKRGSKSWEMGSPDEVNSITLGYKTRSVDNKPCRYISWDNTSLKANMIGSSLVLYNTALTDGTGLMVIYKGWK